MRCCSRMNVNILVKKIAAIEKLGTRVASFTYNGIKRNVIVGADNIRGGSPYRSLAQSKAGDWYLVPRVMNDSEKLKAFRLDRISDFRCASVNHIK